MHSGGRRGRCVYDARCCNGGDLAPYVFRATDTEGREYLTSIQSKNGVNFLRLWAGFGIRPKDIVVRLTACSGSPASPHKEITLTRIAEPHRLISTPTAGEAAAADMWPLPRPGKILKHPISKRGLIVKLTPISPSAAPHNSLEPGIGLQTIDVWPTPAAMGLDSLRISLAPSDSGPVEDGKFRAIQGSDRTLVAQPGSNSSIPSEIPELKIRVRISVSSKVSSEVLVLPIHHAKP